MKKLLVVMVCAVMIFGELAIMNIKAAAKRLVDERAAAVLREARTALGGEANINNVNNLVVVGKMTHKFKLPNQEERTIEGNLEMALEANKIHKMVKSSVGDPNAADVKRIEVEEKDVVVIRKGEASPDKIRLEEGTAEPGTKRIVRSVRANHQGELPRLWLGLLLKTASAETVYAGEGNVDGNACDIIETIGADGSRTKVYISKSTRLPLMLAYRGSASMQKIMIRKSAETPANGEELKDVVVIKTPEGSEKIEGGERKVIVRKQNGDFLVEGDAKTAHPFRIALEEADIQIRFEDFRSVNGLMLPHKWTQTVNGQVHEVTTIDAYEINAQNIAERFKTKVEVLKK